MLLKKSIKKFQKMYEEGPGKEMSYETAQEETNKLFRLFEIVYGSPLVRVEYQTLIRNGQE